MPAWARYITLETIAPMSDDPRWCSACQPWQPDLPGQAGDRGGAALSYTTSKWGTIALGRRSYRLRDAGALPDRPLPSDLGRRADGLLRFGSRQHDAPPMRVNTAALTCAEHVSRGRGVQRKRLDTRFAQRRLRATVQRLRLVQPTVLPQEQGSLPALYDSCHSLKRFSSSVTLSAHQSSSMIAFFGLVKSGRSRWVSGFRSATAAVLLGE